MVPLFYFYCYLFPLLTDVVLVAFRSEACSNFALFTCGSDAWVRDKGFGLGIPSLFFSAVFKFFNFKVLVKRLSSKLKNKPSGPGVLVRSPSLMHE